MEHKKSEALILRTIDYGESDLIVTFFSTRFGTLKGVAKGARRSSRRFVNSLNIFSLVNVEFTEKKKIDLVWLDSCELIDSFPGVSSEYNLLSKASYMIEATEALFPLNMPSTEMFRLLKNALTLISDKQYIKEIITIFQARAMKISGFAINLTRCGKCGRSYKGKGRALFCTEKGSILCMACEKETALLLGMEPETVRTLKQIQLSDPPYPSIPAFSEETFMELKKVLIAHTEYHIGKKLKSARYLNTNI